MCNCKCVFFTPYDKQTNDDSGDDVDDNDDDDDNDDEINVMIC